MSTLYKNISILLALLSLIFSTGLYAQPVQEMEKGNNPPGLNPDHAENLYDQLLEKQGIEAPKEQPGTSANKPYNPYREQPSDFEEENN